MEFLPVFSFGKSIEQTELHKKETAGSLEKEQNNKFWDQNTENSREQLRRQLDKRNLQLQSMEKALKGMRMECHRQMECQSAKDEKEARICEMELEKVQLLNTCTKRLQALNDAKLGKGEILQEPQAGLTAMSPMIRTQEVKSKKSKEKERKVSK
ncbi:hypothetical protein TURU_022394 [Turdus rufiventris]|nr:hypothetical protein TURU_022394 [Turdus rufiventris]